MMSARYWDVELETMSWSEVQRLQGKQIGRQLLYLYDRSPFYRVRLAALRSRLDTLTSIAVLAELPFTLKDDLRAAQEAATVGEPLGAFQAAPIHDIVQTVSSSGTTGRPVIYGLTRNDLQLWRGTIAQSFYTAGLRADDVAALFVGLPMVAGGLPYADGFREIGATLVWPGGYPTARMLQVLRYTQASALLSTTSFATYLPAHSEAEIGIPASQLGIRKLLLGGEPGLAEAAIRERIREGWGAASVRDTMGLADVLASMWSECEAEDGLHFNAQRSVIIELIDPATGEQRPWQEGERGEVVYTNLSREATPVLRFRSRDHVVVTGMTCSCGRTSPRIRCVGRTDDMLIYKGMNVFPTAIREVILQRFAHSVGPAMRLWKEREDQMRFDLPIPLEIELLHRGEAPGPSLAGEIEQRVRELLQVRVSVTLVSPGTLPRSAYKTPLVQTRPTE